MATVFPRVKTAKHEPDTWLDKLREDVRNPVKVLVFVTALIAFVWWAVSFVTGG
jgi:hypothetical protein